MAKINDDEYFCHYGRSVFSVRSDYRLILMGADGGLMGQFKQKCLQFLTRDNLIGACIQSIKARSNRLLD